MGVSNVEVIAIANTSGDCPLAERESHSHDSSGSMDMADKFLLLGLFANDIVKLVCAAMRRAVVENVRYRLEVFGCLGLGTNVC